MTPDQRDREEPGSAGRAGRAALELARLEAEAQHHRNRLALYNARVLTGKPSSQTRLEELRRISAAADARLAHAKTQ
jgi:phage/plasmid-associated DNA primase